MILNRFSVAFISGIFLFIFFGCDYGRMREDEAVDLYELPMPEMPSESVPIHGGLNELRAADLEKLSNSLPDTRETVALGARNYGYYCDHCHGPEGRGYGTVGQSFAPLPTNLRNDYVQLQSDGMIYYRVSMGFLRHPPLYFTVSKNDRWAIIRFIRTLAERSPENSL